MTRESDLVARAARGDRDAFDALVGPRWERMVRIARRIVGEREEARDVAQTAALRLWTTLDRFRPGEDLDGWIYRIVTNLAIDALRRRRARPERAWPERPDGAPAFEPADPAPSPSSALLGRELERRLDEATRDLPPRQKAVFVLSRIEGMSAPEVGRVLGISSSTVRNHLLQLRAALAERLAPPRAGDASPGREDDDP